MGYYNKEIKILVILLIAASMFLLIPEAVYAAAPPPPPATPIRPDGDSSPLEWTPTPSGTHYTTINEDVTQPIPGDTSEYVDNGGDKNNEDRYTMETISGIGVTTKVKVWVYANCTEKRKTLKCKLYWTGGDKEKDIKISKDAANEWGWASKEFNVKLGQAELNSLKVRIKAKDNGMTFYVATLYADVTYTEPTWASDRESYDSDYHIVYMTGEGFAKDHDYKVAYYDGDDVKIQAEVTSSDRKGKLSSQYDFTENSGATAGTWHSVVLDTTGSAPNNYDDAIADPNYVIDDDFYVAESAIPEFPDVIAAIAVCMLCAGAYMVMRRNGRKG